MAKFDISLPYILKHEGTWSDDPADPGGPTNYGITLATAQRHGIETKEALRAITQKEVAQIYATDYWRFSGILDQRVATKLFDMAVNMGLKTAIRHLQTILNREGAWLVLDGICGPKTTQAANAKDPDKLLAELCQISSDYYRTIVARRPTSEKFLKGWLRRAKEVPNA